VERTNADLLREESSVIIDFGALIKGRRSASRAAMEA